MPDFRHRLLECCGHLPGSASDAETAMAELTKKLQLTEQQQKQIAPLVAERDKKAEALEADKSMGKLQKLKQAMQLQTDFHNGAAKYLNADQVKKLDALQAERRAKLTKGHISPILPHNH